MRDFIHEAHNIINALGAGTIVGIAMGLIIVAFAIREIVRP